MKGTAKHTVFGYLCAFLCAVAALSFGSFFGCGKTDDTVPDDPSAVVSVTIDKKALTIAEWESAILTVTANGTDESIFWSSSDESVATVKEGKVFAVSCGEAIITASVKNASDKCTVTVVPSEVEPTVSVNEIQGKDECLIISDNSEFDLTCSVLWNAKIIEGAVISWFSADENVASVEGNGKEATIKGVAAGETTVKVLAEIRKKVAVYEFKVKVNAESALLKANNDGYVPYSGGYKTTINAVEAQDGDGSNVTVPDIYATYKGQIIKNPSVLWTTENEDLINIEPAVGKITAKQAGRAVVYGVWHYDVTNKDYTIKLVVEILRVTVVSEELREVVINRPQTAVKLPLTDETVQSLEIDDKRYEDGFVSDSGVATLDNAKFDVADQRRTIAVKVVTNKRVYEFFVKSHYAVADAEEWQAIWNAKTAPAIFSKASVVIIEEDIDVSSYTHKGNIVFIGSFSGVFDGQGHTVIGATASWAGMFNSIAEDGVLKNVAFVGATLLKDAKLFNASMNGTLENFYFEGTHRLDLAINAAPAFAFTLGRKAVINNVILNVRGRKTNPAISGTKALFNDLNAGEGMPSINNFYASIDFSDGSASKDETVNKDINLYSSMSEMRESLTTLPEGFSREIWQMLDGTATFKSSEKVIGAYLENNELKLEPISFVMQNEDVTLRSNVACEWEVEGLSSADYSLVDGVLRLNENTIEGTTFNIAGYYTEERFGHFYKAKIENVLIKRYTITKKLDELHVVGLNRPDATYTFTLDSDDEILSVTINNAKTDDGNYSLSGNKLTVKASAFIKTGVSEIAIETKGVIYKAAAEVFDMTIGSLEEFKAFWNTSVMTGTVTLKVALTDNIDATGYDNGGNIAIPEFAGVLDGRGYTIHGVRSGWNGLFYNLTADGVVKNIAFTDIRFVTKSAIFGYKLEGTVENCYFEGVGEVERPASAVASPLLATSIGKTATIKNVMLYADNRPETCLGKNAVFDFTAENAATVIAPVGVFVINTASNGNICDETTLTDLGGISLYDSLGAFKSAVKTLPKGFSSEIWQIYEGVLTFKSSQTVIEKYIEQNGLTAEKISSVTQLTDTKLVADKDCEWTIEGLDSSAYTLENGLLRLNEKAIAGTLFNIFARYSEPRYGHVYEDVIENVVVKKYVETKKLEEEYVVGLNRVSESYSFVLDSADAIISVSINNAEIDMDEYSLSENVLTLNASAFTKAGFAEIAIKAGGYNYYTTAEVYDIAIGSLEEFKGFWSKEGQPATTVTTKVAFTADIDASSYNFNGGTVIANSTFNGIIDGKGHTVKGAPSGYYGMFYCVGSDAVIKNIAFTGIRFFRVSAIVNYKLEGRIENCYFEGSGGSAADNNALSKQMGATAVLKNVVVYLHDRPSGTETQCGVFVSLTSGATSLTTAPEGVYVVNDSSNGKICDGAGATDLSDVHLYSSLGEFKAQNTTKPNNISEEYWQLLNKLA